VGDATFWSQFWPDLVATLVGAFVGIWLALRVDHARDQRARGTQEAALVRAARDAVQANLELVKHLKVILPQGLTVPTFMMDVGLLDVMLPRLAELSVDTKLLEELNRFRYQLHHVNRKLDHMLTLSRFPLVNLQAELAQIAGSTMPTLAVLEGSGNQTLPPLFDARLATLEQPARGLRRFLSA
jgi:hypothetical protein